MATPSDNTVAITGNSLIDGITQGSSWAFSAGAPHVITYSFSVNDSDVPANNPQWIEALSNAVRTALTEWSNVAAITFSETGSGTVYRNSSADMAIILTGSELQQVGIASLGIFPSPAFATATLADLSETRFTYPKPEGDIALDNNYSAFNYLNAGGLGLTFILHEIGHALGLKHPFDDGANGRPTFSQLGISYLDNTDATIMSYTSPNGSSILFTPESENPSTPMVLDILAIQNIYGTNYSYHSGNDNYLLRSEATTRTIWDAGGVDTIDGSDTSGSSGIQETIDLRPGHYSSAGTSTLAIAYNALIENAIAGSGNDAMIGNDIDNMLSGGAGNDTMSGGLGNDTYLVDTQFDSVTESSNQGVDTVVSSVSFTLPDNVENLTLSGSSSLTAMGNDLDNVLTGNQGSDFLYAGAGNDTLIPGVGISNIVMMGGSGNDTYYVNGNGNAIMPGNALWITGNPDNYPLSASNVLLANPSAQLSVNLSDRTGNGVVDYLDIYYFDSTPNATHFYLFTLGTNQLGQDLAIGTYQNAERAAFASPGHAGIDLGYDGIGHNTVFGSFTVNDLAIDYARGVPALLRLSVDFSLSDTLNGPLTFGAIRFGEADAHQANILENIGAGDDRVISSASYILPDNVETLVLGGSDNIDGTGNTLGNLITGNAGNNILAGGAGADSLDGGLGFDTADFRASGSGITAFLSTTLGAGAGGDATGDLYTSIEGLIGSNFADVLVGAAGVANFLTGSGGDDVLYGEGLDTLEGGIGDDVLFGGQGGALNLNLVTASLETVWGSVVGDTLDGSSSSANLILIGQGGADTLIGGAGNDFFYFDQFDSLFGGMGSDWAVASLALTGVMLQLNAAELESAWGSPFDDVLDGAGASSTLVLVGDVGSDGLTGGNATDYLYGQDGSDVLAGGGGTDIMTGGDGNDAFVYAAPTGLGTDLIYDFTSGTDHFEFSAVGFGVALGTSLTNGTTFISEGAPVATTAAPTVLYDTAMGMLNFDADGTGGAAAVPVAFLVGHPVLAAGDFVFA